MAPHLTAAEQDFIMKANGKGKEPVEIQAALALRRQKNEEAAPDLTAVRRFLKGKTHQRGRSETRGRKSKVSRRNVLNMNSVRRTLVKKDKGTRYVKWDEIIRKSRAPPVHRSTAARAFKREDIKAIFRRSREKPQRTVEHEAERVEICGRMRRWPLRRYTEVIDMIIDNKKFDVPTSARARDNQARQKVIGQIRTPQEGLEKGFTKPNSKRHRMNPGGSASVCAGISNCQVVLWEYFDGRWNGEKAAEMYQGPIIKALKKKRGVKAKYLLVEDNDPTGYKSGKGIDAKQELGIETVPWPRYSPDLNPLDFSLWRNIEDRMAKSAPRGRESVECYKLRLRRTALSTPRADVTKMVLHMRKRADAIWHADGQDIPRD